MKYWLEENKKDTEMVEMYTKVGRSTYLCCVMHVDMLDSGIVEMLRDGAIEFELNPEHIKF